MWSSTIVQKEGAVEEKNNLYADSFITSSDIKGLQKYVSCHPGSAVIRTSASSLSECRRNIKCHFVRNHLWFTKEKALIRVSVRTPLTFPVAREKDSLKKSWHFCHPLFIFLITATCIHFLVFHIILPQHEILIVCWCESVGLHMCRKWM